MTSPIAEANAGQARKPVYTFDQVRRMLPQSHPFIMVDVVEEVEPNERIVCRKNVSGGDFAIPGHFPEKAIYPGVLLIEGLAQSGILLFQASEAAAGNAAAGTETGANPSQADEPAPTYLLAGVKVRFLHPVVPGDQVKFECRVVKLASTGGIMEGVGTVDGVVAVKADLTFAVTRDKEE